MLTYEQIKDLIKSIDCSSLRVFELEDQDFKLKLKDGDNTNVNNLELKENLIYNQYKHTVLLV